MAPPPPPPPPPPPIGGPPPVAAPPKLSKNEAMDRNALLSQIRGGTKLKKTKTVNDRSAPLTTVSSGDRHPGGLPGGSQKPLADLFAGGVPKLKPTGSKLVSNGLTVSANKVSNSCTKTDESVRPSLTTNTSSIKTSLEEKFSQNNSSFLHSKTSSTVANSGYVHNVVTSSNNNNNSNKFHTMKPRDKPSYVLSEGKGQAPQVPSQTPVNSSNSSNRCNAPELPRKPPGVQRSNSQSSGRSGAPVGRRPGPPNMKPPPPPKMTPPKAPPSARPPNGPPPPPKIPPPKVLTQGQGRPPNVPPPSLPPPPLPPPPSQTNGGVGVQRRHTQVPPPPPVRNTSITRDRPMFSSRFAQFKAIFELPAPTPMTATNKVYPSHMRQSQRRRDPPPPPPQPNGMASHSPNTNAHNNAKKSNPVLHIQIGSNGTQLSSH